MARRARLTVTVVSSVLALLGIAGSASAVFITSNPSMPPIGGTYMTPAGVEADYISTGIHVILTNLRQSGFTNIAVNTIGADEVESCSSFFTGLDSINGGTALPIFGTAPVTVRMFGKAGQITGIFAAEMTQLDLTTNLPGAMIRISPTLTSTGQTSITDIGGGLYQVDSYFDLFTELSTNGGVSWIPSTAPTRVVLVPEPATLSVVAMVAISLLARRRNLLATR